LFSAAGSVAVFAFVIYGRTVLELSGSTMANYSGGMLFLHGLWRFCLMFFASAAIGVLFGLVSAMISFGHHI
jgi:hypothetical protein